jgi:hypothetical protein
MGEQTPMESTFGSWIKRPIGILSVFLTLAGAGLLTTQLVEKVSDPLSRWIGEGILFCLVVGGFLVEIWPRRGSSDLATGAPGELMWGKLKWPSFLAIAFSATLIACDIGLTRSHYFSLVRISEIRHLPYSTKVVVLEAADAQALDEAFKFSAIGHATK